MTDTHALRVVLAGGDGEAAALAQALGDEVAVEHLRADDVPVRLARAPAPDALALLPDVPDPLALVQLAGSVDHDLAVLVLADAAGCAELTSRLLFTPFIGPHARCVASDDVDDVAVALTAAARDSRSRRRYVADLAAGTERLAAAAPAPSATAAASLATVLDAAPVGILVVDGDGRVRRWTAPAATLLGVRPRDLPLADLVAPEDRAELARRLGAPARVAPDAFVVRLDGGERSLELTIAEYLAPDGEQASVVFVVDATQRVRLEAERRRVEREQRFLAAAGAVLDASLDLGETLERIAHLAVPELGDLCVIDSLDPDGRFRTATVIAEDAGVADAVRSARAQWPVRPDADHPAARVVRTRRPELLAAVRPEDLERGAQSPEHLAVLRRLGYRSAVAAPLAARGRTHGAITVVRLSDTTPYAASDLALVEALADRAATALDNAWLFERERSIAATLQRALLPDRLPAVRGARIAARYHPAAHGLDVGGDWYDAVPTDDGRVGLAIGDVVGRGLAAAIVMGQLRNFLRAHAVAGADPGALLERLARLMAQLGVGEFATVLYALVDVGSGDVRLASAGHPPPVLVAPDGTATLVDAPAQPPLVPGIEARRRTHRLQLEPGATLLLYTDGVVERRTEPIDVGLQRLLRAATGADPDLEALCDRVLAASGPEGARDDRALVALRRLPG